MVTLEPTQSISAISAPKMHRNGEQLSAFCRVLDEAFPDRNDLPRGCPIVEGLIENQSDLTEEIRILDRVGGRQDLIDRLRRQHPVRRSHKVEHDRNFWRAWTEAIGLAWAVETAGYESPQFTPDESGLPDLDLGSRRWLEAKTVDNSPEEAAILDQQAAAGFGMRMFAHMSDLDQNVLRKFEDHLQNALNKSERTECDELTVFYSISIDGGTSQRSAYREIEVWATEAADRVGVRIVIVKNMKWQNPFVDTARSRTVSRS